MIAGGLAQGLAARDRAPLENLRWDPRRRGHDALTTITSQGDIRRKTLLPLRYERMAASPWTYYRGAAAVAAADLASRADTGLTVQLCGDAHILNFGLWATPERNLFFDLRDFDETLPGPFEWDVSRLVASIVVLGRDTDVKAARVEKAVAACLLAYRRRMSAYSTAKRLDIWYDRVAVDDFIGLFRRRDRDRVKPHIAKKAEQRSNEGSARKLTEIVGGRLRITDSPPIRTHLEDGVAESVFTAYRESLREDRRSLLDRFTVVDVVQQVVGVGSVGMRVFLVLLTGRDQSDPLFLQIKQAGPSVYEPFCGAGTHPNHGERVVAGKRLLQSATDIFVGWTEEGGLDFYVRQFRDMKVIADGGLLAPRLVEFATACGGVLARAHARTGDPAAIAGFIGKGRTFDAALGQFAQAYADQTERDHRQLVRALLPGGMLEPST